MYDFPASDIPLILTAGALRGEHPPGLVMGRLLMAMLTKGFDWDELPPDLRATSALGYYIGNVLNGGHSQFVGNAFNYFGVGPARMLRDAAEAARAYRLPQTLSVIGQAQAWLAANPEEARRQTGFTGGRAPALDPLDKALMAADMVDEAAWLAILAPLPPEVADRLAQGEMCRHPEYPLKFPQRCSGLHEAVFLLTRKPRRVVPETGREPDAELAAAVAAAVAAMPGARNRALRRELADLAQALPKPATCAVMDLLNQSGFWKGRPNDARLNPVLTRKGKAEGSWESVLRVKGGSENLLVTLSPKGQITVSATTGRAENPFSLQLPEPVKTRGLPSLMCWFSKEGRKRRRIEKVYADVMAKNALRATGVIAAGPSAPGDRIAAGLHALHVAEAVAQWIVDGNLKSLNAWRLLRWHDGADPVQDWLFGTIDGPAFEVVARKTAVLIRQPGADEVTTYPHEGLVALRRALG